MAQAKKSKQKKGASKQAPQRSQERKAAPLASAPSFRNYYIALFIIIIVTFISYLPAIHNGFVWDDQDYIVRDRMIHAINLKELFSNYVMGNYHPLTMLSYSLEYHFWGLSTKGYHVVNIMLHLLNTILVFYTVFLLSKKPEVACIAALLFGIHPMHVESVAWVSERKDLLYAFFYLASYICWLSFLKHKQRKYYFYGLLLFLLSLFSKATAASLPLLLLLTDYFKERKINLKTILEKAPFFILSVIFGAVAVAAQKTTTSSVQDSSLYSFLQRISFASYGFITYLWKLVVPLHLCALYPYPLKSGMSSEGSIPFFYYLYPLFLLIFVAGVLYTLRFTKKIFLGIGFYAVTVFLVLQLFAVGDAIIADRYIYIPSTGIFFLAGEGIYILWHKKRKVVAVMLLSCFSIFFIIKTYAQCDTWKDDFSLWNNVISQYQTVNKAYNNRGLALKNQNRDDEALEDYNKAIEISPNYFEAHNNRAVILTAKKRYDEAMSDLNQAIAVNPDNASAHYNRGVIWSNKENYEQALNDYNKVVELDPDFTDVYNNRAIILLHETRYEEALKDFNKAIEMDPKSPNAYLSKGTLFTFEKKYEDALTYYSKAIEIAPDFGAAYYNRGIVENTIGKKEAACTDLKKAITLDYSLAQNAYNLYCH